MTQGPRSGRPLDQRVEAAIAAATGEPACIVGSQAVGGGCINDSRLIVLGDGRRYFLKANHDPGLTGMFEAEYEALAAIAASGKIRVPVPLTCAADFIVMEAFERGRKGAQWQVRMGAGLAELHRGTEAPRFGFTRDNYLGSTPQPNAWSDEWPEFWRSRRLEWQLKLFADSGHAGDKLIAMGRRLLERLDELIGEPSEPAVLLHGDLWSGNADADEHGQPIIYDPASYYGRREAEFGIMRMFGGFDRRCEAAYREVWPLAPGSDERIAIYRLYHELNHLNLFGRSYYAACLATIERFL
jgi:fructosamine-3-kinase